MPDTTTSLGLTKIGVNESNNTWGDKTNANQDRLDALITARVTNDTFSSYQGTVSAAIGARMLRAGDTMSGDLRINTDNGNHANLFMGAGGNYLNFNGNNFTFFTLGGLLYLSYGGGSYVIWGSHNFNPDNKANQDYLSVVGFDNARTKYPYMRSNNGDYCGLVMSNEGNYRGIGVDGGGNPYFIRFDDNNVRYLATINPSDFRLKNITDFDNVPSITDLELVTFGYNDIAQAMGAPDGLRYGILADQLQRVLPTAVVKKGEYLFLSSDASVQMIASILADLKKLKARVKELENG